MHNYVIITLKNKKDIATFSDAINWNRAFHQLVKNWQFWQRKEKKSNFYVLNGYLLFKDTLTGLIRFLATENPLKMMKITFYFA